MLVVPNSAEVLLLNALKALGPPAGPLNAVTCHLYQNDVTPTSTSDVATFVEADYGGYATQPIVWGATFMNPDGNAETNGESLQFQPSSSATPNSIYGYFVTDTGGALMFAERFSPAPRPMATPSDALVVVPVFTLASQG
jgi:hypothetical protein